MPLISNLAVLAQMPIDYILIIISTAKEERIPETTQRRCLRARNEKHLELGVGFRIQMGGERNNVENRQKEKSNETTAATIDLNFLWAKMNDELYKGDENAERSEKGGCKGTLTEKDNNLIHTEKEYLAALEESNRIMKASRPIQSDKYDRMNRRMIAFRTFQDRSNKEYMRSLERANDRIELGWS